MTQGAGQEPDARTMPWAPVPSSVLPPSEVPSPVVPSPVVPSPAVSPPAVSSPAAPDRPYAAPHLPPERTAVQPPPPRPLPDQVPVAPPPPPGPGYTPTEREIRLPEYTPTQRDMKVVDRAPGEDPPTVDLAPVPDPRARASSEGPGPLYVVGDVHGYLDQLCEALTAQGLTDAGGHWAAGTARLWFLGDFTDRGPDGIGVIELVMRLSAEAAAAGGYCKALMGNHELLLLGAKRFGETPVASGAGTASFRAAWLLNGGQRTDMERLEDHHLQWMSRLDAMAEEDGHLLVHSDTTAYLDYGDSIEAVNDTVTEVLQRGDAEECWDLFRKFTKRFAFRDEGGPRAARDLLDVYGGERIVHGHSPIPYLLGEVGSEESEETGPPAVEGPHVYADGLAVAMDGGVTMAGKLLVQQLPLTG